MNAFLPRNKKLKEPSRKLRKDSTSQENRLWYDFLRNIKPRFTRQRVISNYIVDFYCHKLKLVIELDGSQHYQEENEKQDLSRMEYMNSLGIKVIRFSNLEIERDFSAVCQSIITEMQTPVSFADSPFQKGPI